MRSRLVVPPGIVAGSSVNLFRTEMAQMISNKISYAAHEALSVFSKLRDVHCKLGYARIFTCVERVIIFCRPNVEEINQI